MDDTLANTRHRRKGDYMDWSDEAIMKDKPTSIAKNVFDPNNIKTYISTSRTEQYRKITIKWLEEKLGMINVDKYLFMKVPGLSNIESKRKNLNKIKKLNPEGTKFKAYDDNKAVIEMYKEEGCKTRLVDVI